MSYLVWDSVNNFGTTGAAAVGASFRACCQAFHLKMLEAGFMIGLAAQADFLSTPVPATPFNFTPPVGSYEHFKIYRLGDSLDATYPLFIKVYFNGMTNYGQVPCFPVQVGTTCDSSGVLGGLVTDVVLPSEGFNYGNQGGKANSAASAIYHAEGAAWVSYNRGGMSLGSGIPRPSLFFILERIVDANGNPASGGYHLVVPSGHDLAASPGLKHRTITESFDSGWSTNRNCKVVAGYTAIAANGVIQFQRMFMLTPVARPMRTVLLCHSSQVVSGVTTVLEQIPGQPETYWASGTGISNCGSVADPNFDLMQICLRT